LILITSAAYVVPEIGNELGLIPPCFLPIGNRRLLELQVETIRKYFKDRIVVTLPASFVLSKNDVKLFEALDLDLIEVPDRFNLAESVSYALNMLDHNDLIIRILHGDTLIFDLPEELDVICVGIPLGDYDWEVESATVKEDVEAMVWSGFFAFSSKRELIRSLSLSGSNFVKAVRKYGELKTFKHKVCVEWLDFGHVNAYFISRAKVTTQRSFNTLVIEDGVVYKSGVNASKIQAEEYWYRHIPPGVKKYMPQLLDFGVADDKTHFYCLEYLPFLPLNELFVYGRNSLRFWNKQFTLLNSFLEEARLALTSSSVDKDEVSLAANNLYGDKTIKRLDEFIETSWRSLDTIMCKHDGEDFSLLAIRDDCIFRAKANPVVTSIVHGDLCFSNILYDSRSDRLKIIDPRGLSGTGQNSIFGDQKYDIAKLVHSIIGLYDLIISGEYSLYIDKEGFEAIRFDIDDRIIAIQELFLSKMLNDEITFRNIMAIVVLLFLSMLPLHADNKSRQNAMILNAVRLYKQHLLMY
jgi:hypothetical protein